MDAERDARCPAGFRDRATDDWRVVVCADTGGPDAETAIAAAHEYFGETCAEITSASECTPSGTGHRRGCEWVPPERHEVFENGACSTSDQGVCLFVSGYYGDEELCLERETADGRETITLPEGYEHIPRWERSYVCGELCQLR